MRLPTRRRLAVLGIRPEAAATGAHQPASRCAKLAPRARTSRGAGRAAITTPASNSMAVSSLLHARNRGLPLVCSYYTQIARYAHFSGMGLGERRAPGQHRANQDRPRSALTRSQPAPAKISTTSTTSTGIASAALMAGPGFPSSRSTCPLTRPIATPHTTTIRSLSKPHMLLDPSLCLLSESDQPAELPV